MPSFQNEHRKKRLCLHTSVLIVGHSIFYPHTPYGRQPLTKGLLEYFFKEADKILNPSDANFKGSDNKKLGCGMSLHGVARKR